MDFKKLNDKELYYRCRFYGFRAKQYLRKFAGLLPEVRRRELYKKKGFTSIYEFAAKLAGMSHESVDRILRLSERLSDKPTLLHQLQAGEQSWSKIEKVSYIATPETEKEWAEKINILPQPSLELYIRAYREKSVLQNELQNDKALRQLAANDCWNKLSFPVSPEIEKALYILKQQLEKERKTPLSWNDIMKFFLDEKEKLQKSEPVRIIQLCQNCVSQKANKQEQENPKRYIPAEVKHVVSAQYGKQCVFPKCRRPSDILHHVRRFALHCAIV